MSEQYGYIVVHRDYSPLGIVNDWYEWRGGPVAWVGGYWLTDTVDCAKLSAGDVFSIGHLRLRVIKAEVWHDMFVVMQDGWRARLTAQVWKAGHVVEGIYRRLILTAAVWGMADFHPATIPTWRDLRLPRSPGNARKT